MDEFNKIKFSLKKTIQQEMVERVDHSWRELPQGEKWRLIKVENGSTLIIAGQY